MSDEARNDDGNGNANANDADEDWVVLSTYDRPELARMTLDFLRDHDIPVQTRGDSPEGVRNLYSPFDIRIVVPSERLEEAREALAAFTAEPTDATPFRGPLPPPELAGANDEGEQPAAALRTRRGPFAFVLAFLVPIGGGHFYAQHNAAGSILAVAFVLFVVGSVQAGTTRLAFAMAVAAGMVVTLDAIVSMLVAVRRCNEKRIPSAGTQRATALGLVGVALGSGFAWSYLSSVARNLGNADAIEQCDSHDASACFDVGRWYERNDPYIGSERSKDYYRRACMLGDQRGCAAIQ